MIDAELIRRFYQRIDDKNINSISGCWLWTGETNDRGYGRIRYKDINYIASRLSWMIMNGDIPPKLHVLHRCDNPPCVRPEHLFLGTTQDNSRDRALKKFADEMSEMSRRSNFTTSPTSYLRIKTKSGLNRGINAKRTREDTGLR